MFGVCGSSLATGGIGMRTCVKPLMYGYLRATELGEDEVQELECGLTKLAEAESF